jgi:hypothetical protein
MPLAIGSSSLYGIKGQVVVRILAGASFLIVLIALEAAPAELTPGQVARLDTRVSEPQQRLPRMERYLRKLRARSIW